MIRKTFAGFLMLSSIWAFCSITTTSKDTLSDLADADIVSVNIFNQYYFGTLTETDSDSDAVFTSLPSSGKPSFQIEGTWKGDSFKGNCTITRKDGSICSVKYKKGIISGPVSILDPDGSTKTFQCTSGIPYKQQHTYDKNGTLTDTDWYYLGNLQDTWKQASITPSYSALMENPYEYVGLPVRVSGTVQAVYETTRYSYLKIADPENHIYLFKYINLRIDKYAPANIKNLSTGDHVTLYGKYLGPTSPEDQPINLFEHSLGYEVPFKDIRNSIVDNDFWTNYNRLALIKDEDLHTPVPEMAVICGKTTQETIDPDHLTGEYSEICEYPFYYMDQKINLKGVVLYENYDPDIQRSTLLIQKEKSKELYAVTWQTDHFSSLMNKNVSCKGYLNGNNKIPYFNPETFTLGYALYPNITAEKISE